jgi:hypothetical protein
VSITEDLSVYARRCELEATRHRERAASIRAEAEARVARTGGVNVEPHHKRIRDQAAVEADRELERARFKSERAAVASRGYLLVREDGEARDGEFMREHGPLFSRAHAAGLVTDKAE